MDFMLFIEPKAQKRHRHTKLGHVYNPSSKDLRALAKEIQDKCNKFDWEVTDEPCNLEVTFGFEMPKGWSKEKRKEMRGKPHTSKPDLSNLLKLFEDACTNIIWEDDRQVASIYAKKVYFAHPFISFKVKVEKC